MGDSVRTIGGRYELAGVVGRGGMGIVYRATDLVLGRTVAVKLLAAALLEDPLHVARFEREARAAASVAHRGVVTVYDTGVDAGAHFIVMELVSGRSLTELIADHRGLDPDRAIAIATDVADALAAAHAAGLVHRDIKPANVMVDDAGRVKVLDFGIARALDGTALTQTSSILGTAAYMSPEQAIGKPADERSDIYSLGCLVYALLTGRPPFAGDASAAITHQHVHVDPVPLRQANQRLPPALDALVMEMLSKAPAARPQTAVDVRDRLGRILADDAAAAAATERVYPEADAPLVPRAPAAPRPAADAHLPAPDPPDSARMRRRLVVGLGAGLVLVVVLVVLIGRHPGGPGAPAGGSGSVTSGKAATTGSAPVPGGAATTHTPTPKAPATPATPTTPAVASPVAGAAAGLATLVTQAAQAGLISPDAAAKLTAGLNGLVSSLDAGNANDAQQKLADLVRQAGALETQGQIGTAVAVGLNAALAAVGSAVAAAQTPAAASGGAGASGAAEDGSAGASGAAGDGSAGASAGAGAAGRFPNNGPQNLHGRGPFGRAGSFPG